MAVTLNDLLNALGSLPIPGVLFEVTDRANPGEVNVTVVGRPVVPRERRWIEDRARDVLPLTVRAVNFRYEKEPAVQREHTSCFLSAMREGANVLSAQGIKGCLIGTAGLWLHGLLLDDPPDIDFACEREPKGSFIKPVPEGKTAESSPCTAVFYGIKLHFLAIPTEVMKRLPESEVFMGVPLASVEDIIHIKCAAGRPKDRLFLEEWDRKVQKVASR